MGVTLREIEEKDLERIMRWHRMEVLVQLK